MYRVIILLSLILTVRFLLFYSSPQESKIEKSFSKESTIFFQIREKIDNNFNKNLNSEHAALLLGIVFGNNDLSAESFETFRKTGVLHVVAASGMNVSMLVSFLLAILLVMFRRQQALFICAFAILIYTGLASFQPSIVRAALMSGFALAAGVVGRQNTSLLALFFAGFVMLFWDPIIIENIGFQLSFLATIGIILFAPVFNKLGFQSPFFEDFKTSIAAQMATMPLILFLFGKVSAISVIVNLLVLWTIPPLMILGFLASAFSLISPFLSLPFHWLAIPLLSYFYWITGFFLYFAPEISLEHIPWAIIVGYYLIAMSGVLVIYKKLKISA